MTTFRYDDFARHDPARAVDWRWRRAIELLTNDQYFSTKRDDTATGKAVAFLRQMERASASRRPRPGSNLSDVLDAYQLCHGDARRRLELESRLLARQSIAEIAELLNVRSDVVRAYEALFFNVTDRIMCSDYISLRAIRQTNTGNTSWGQLAEFVRAVAYFGGILALEAIWPLLDDLLDAKDTSPTAWPRKSESPADALRRRVGLLFVAHRERSRMISGKQETAPIDHASQSPQYAMKKKRKQDKVEPSGVAKRSSAEPALDSAPIILEGRPEVPRV